MAVNRATFEQIMKHNVVEFKNVRRHPKSGAPITRRYFATNSPAILNTEFGKKVFKFKPPTKPRPYNPRLYNLVFVWDIFKQDYRAVACETVTMIQIFPVTNEKLVNKFWIHVRDKILTMSRSQRMAFFNR